MMLPFINYKHNFFYFNKLLEIGYSETNPFIFKHHYIQS